MSKSLKLAAVAAALVVGSTSVYATSVLPPLPPLPPLPTGPGGLDGMPFLFAHVLGTGIVDDSVPGGGITQENVRLVSRKIRTKDRQVVVDTTYCFSGLPPIAGGQVTIDGNGRSAELGSPNIDMATQESSCPIRVSIAGPNSFRRAANFYILLY